MLVITRGNTAVAYQQTQRQEPVAERRVRYQRRLRLGPMAAYGVVLILTVSVALLYLSQYALLAHLNLQIANIQGEIKTLERENRDLERQVAYLASLERIERVAREDLGMLPCQQVRYLAVEDFISPDLTRVPRAEQTEEHDPLTQLAGWLRPKTAYAGSPER